MPATLLGVLVALTAMQAPPTPKPVRMLLLELPQDDKLRPQVVQAVNDFLAGALRDQGFEVLTPQDISALLGVDRQKSLMGCTETSCLAEIGGALGAEYIVHGDLVVLDQATALDLVLIDKHAQVLGRARELVRSPSSTVLVEAAEKLVPRLVASVRPGGPILTANPEPQASPAGGLTTPAPKATSRTLTPWIVAGGGAVALIASGVVGVLAKSKADSIAAAPVTASSLAQVSSDRATASSEAVVSTVLTAVGVVAIGVGVVLWFTTSDSPSPPPSPGAT